MSDLEIRAILERRRRALHDRDAAAFLADYAPEAVIFDLAPPLAHGIDAAGVAEWLRTWDGPVGNETRDVEVAVSGRLAFVAGLERLQGMQGGESRDIWFRFTLCLSQRAGGWRIVHEHTSVPFRKGGADLVAAIDLRPQRAGNAGASAPLETPQPSPMYRTLDLEHTGRFGVNLSPERSPTRVREDLP